MQKIIRVCLLTVYLIYVANLMLVYANQSPTWLREGTYVKYSTDRDGYAYLFSDSDLSSNVLSFWNATFGWRCISVNETIAKLEFTFDYIGKKLNNVSLENATLKLAGEIYVHLPTRRVYNLNGSILGTTHMWLTSNPSEGQEVVVWDMPPEKVTLPAKVNNVWFQTIQGKQQGFIVEGTGIVRGKPKNFLLLCDLDTGLMVDGNFEWDPIMTVAGIKVLLLNGRIILSDTNIMLGSAFEQSTGSFIFVLSLPILAFVVLLITFRRIIHKKGFV
ncbi:MAG: hypothetical protein ACPLIG_03905 [Candidatus Bathyarchaeales archaeon]